MSLFNEQPASSKKLSTGGLVSRNSRPAGPPGKRDARPATYGLRMPRGLTYFFLVIIMASSTTLNQLPLQRMLE